MKWVTREPTKIDRIACPWLITRFIDEAPEFLSVPGRQVLEVAARTGAVPYDVPGVEMTHDGDLAQLKKAFGQTREVCNSCHKAFRTQP